MADTQPADVPEAAVDSEWAWSEWWDIQHDLCTAIDDHLDQAAAGRSDQFRAALVASLIEHLAEKQRFYLYLPETDVRKGGSDGVR